MASSRKRSAFKKMMMTETIGFGQDTASARMQKPSSPELRDCSQDCLLCMCFYTPTTSPLYNGFCGSCSTPFIEPETSKFSSQLSAYLLPLRRSAGQACPAYFFT